MLSLGIYHVFIIQFFIVFNMHISIFVNTVSLTRNDPRGGAVGVGKGKTHVLTASRLVANSGNFSSGKIESRIG